MTLQLYVELRNTFKAIFQNIHFGSFTGDMLATPCHGAKFSNVCDIYVTHIITQLICKNLFIKRNCGIFKFSFYTLLLNDGTFAMLNTPHKNRFMHTTVTCLRYIYNNRVKTDSLFVIFYKRYIQ